MKEWFLTSELIRLNNKEISRQSIVKKANRNNWIKRKAQGLGRAFEYHISNLHKDEQIELISAFGDKDELENIQDTLSKLSEQGGLLRQQQSERSNVSKVLPLNECKEWAVLPVYDVHAAAGAGTLIESEFQIGVFSLPVLLLNEYGLKEKYCSVIFVDGNSMEPTISDGDRVLVDIRDVPHPAKDGVYVIRIDDAVYIKRLHWNIEQGIYTVISDNPKYDKFNIDHNNGRNFKIIGKVVNTVMKAVI